MTNVPLVTPQPDVHAALYVDRKDKAKRVAAFGVPGS